MSRIVFVIAGGAEPSSAVQSALPTSSFCVAADSGADHALALGIVPDVVVGDLDSISQTTLEKLENDQAANVTIDRHPAAKDMTDLELALTRALAARPDQLLVLGIDGGRPDHYLANLLAISSPDLASALGSDQGEPNIEALFGTTRLSVVRKSAIIAGEIGDLLTLLPVHGAALDITLNGVEYPLLGEDLAAGSARGLSNVLTETTAQLSVGSGTLLVFQPDALKTSQDRRNTGRETERNRETGSGRI